VGLYFSFRFCRFLFSARRTGGGVPSTSRARDLTAEVARNLDFFFLGTDGFNRKGRGGRKGIRGIAKTAKIAGIAKS